LRQRILVLLGIAVVALALYTFVLRPQPQLKSLSAVAAQAAGSKAGAAQPPVESKTPAPADTTRALTPKVLPPETWGTDPFVRDWVMVNELANLSLKAITLGGERPYALINDQILQEGDEISGKRIVTIESDKVTLEQGGRTFTLLLGE
jgi:hypothetical protein